MRHYKQKGKVKKFHSKLKENYKVGSKPDYKYFEKKEKQKAVGRARSSVLVDLFDRRRIGDDRRVGHKRRWVGG